MRNSQKLKEKYSSDLKRLFESQGTDGDVRMGTLDCIKTSPHRTFASYVYNGDGLRVQKTVDGTVTDYVYSGNYVIAETGKTYLRGLSYHAVIVSNEFYYYFCNSHGDVTGITNEGGNTVATYDYDEFGNLTSQTGSFDNDIRYSGEFYDSESENYYLRSRYYDPTVGRFTQQDSFLGVDDNPLSLNRYTYCHNNPIMYVDPSGHRPLGNGMITYDSNQITSSDLDYEFGKRMYDAQQGRGSIQDFISWAYGQGINVSFFGAFDDFKFIN